MSVLYDLLVVLHLLGMAAIVGGYLTVLRAPRVVVVMVHGALTQLVTGVALAGLAQSGAVVRELSETKLGVKLAVALAVAVLAFVYRGKARVPAGAVHAIGGLAIVNVLVAVLW